MLIAFDKGSTDLPAVPTNLGADICSYKGSQVHVKRATHANYTKHLRTDDVSHYCNHYYIKTTVYLQCCRVLLKEISFNFFVFILLSRESNSGAIYRTNPDLLESCLCVFLIEFCFRLFKFPFC